jgi:hypothetical protein
MIKFIYPDDSHCYRALHSVHAVFRDENGVLMARTDQPDGRWHEFEIKGFELVEPGRVNS